MVLLRIQNPNWHRRDQRPPCMWPYLSPRCRTCRPWTSFPCWWRQEWVRCSWSRAASWRPTSVWSQTCCQKCIPSCLWCWPTWCTGSRLPWSLFLTSSDSWIQYQCWNFLLHQGLQDQFPNYVQFKIYDEWKRHTWGNGKFFLSLMLSTSCFCTFLHVCIIYGVPRILGWQECYLSK